jgi:hypothetical protein
LKRRTTREDVSFMIYSEVLGNSLERKLKINTFTKLAPPLSPAGLAAPYQVLLISGLA